MKNALLKKTKNYIKKIFLNLLKHHYSKMTIHKTLNIKLHQNNFENCVTWTKMLYVFFNLTLHQNFEKLRYAKTLLTLSYMKKYWLTPNYFWQMRYIIKKNSRSSIKLGKKIVTSKTSQLHFIKNISKLRCIKQIFEHYVASKTFEHYVT